jgi:hypothetical protein
MMRSVTSETTINSDLSRCSGARRVDPRAVSRSANGTSVEPTSRQPGEQPGDSSHLFLVGYFILALGVGLALWQTGVLGRVAPIWIGVGALVAIGVGIMRSVSSGMPTVSEEVRP